MISDTDRGEDQYVEKNLSHCLFVTNHISVVLGLLPVPSEIYIKNICYIKSEIRWVISRPSEWREHVQFFRINCSILTRALLCRFVAENLKWTDLNTDWQ